MPLIRGLSWIRRRLIRVAREVNDNKPHIVMEKVYDAVRVTVHPKVACLGLAFKPDIDDLRESPSLQIAEKLAAGSLDELLVVEPNVHELPASLADKKNVRLVSLENAMREANIVLLLVDHKEFKAMDRALLKGKTVIDTRGIFA